MKKKDKERRRELKKSKKSKKEKERRRSISSSRSPSVRLKQNSQFFQKLFQRGRNRSGSSNDCYVIEDKKPEKRTAPITGIYQVTF